LDTRSCLVVISIYRINGFERSAHAALSPWEGQNALDAAVLAYTSISALRQQMRPTHRIHGIFEGRDWAPNGMSILHCSGSVADGVCQSYPGLFENEVRHASLPFLNEFRDLVSWYVRAPTYAEVEVAVKRVTACFE
jgi:hypothetical protein